MTNTLRALGITEDVTQCDCCGREGVIERTLDHDTVVSAVWTGAETTDGALDAVPFRVRVESWRSTRQLCPRTLRQITEHCPAGLLDGWDITISGDLADVAPAVMIADWLRDAFQADAVADAARDWLSDCEFHGLDPEEVRALDDAAALRIAGRAYDGGLRQLAVDSLLVVELPRYRAVHAGSCRTIAVGTIPELREQLEGMDLDVIALYSKLEGRLGEGPPSLVTAAGVTTAQVLGVA